MNPLRSSQSWCTISTNNDTNTSQNTIFTSESPTSSTARSSILRDTHPSTRHAILNSPLIELHIVHTDGYIKIPERLISIFSPYVRARIAELRALIAQNIKLEHEAANTAVSPEQIAWMASESPAVVTLPYVNEYALEWLCDYMIDSCVTGSDKPLEPPPETRNMVLIYHCIRVLQMPFCEKKFQAEIMDVLSKDMFDAGDVKAVWLFMGEWKTGAEEEGVVKNLGRDEKIVSHMVQNVAFRSEDGRLPVKGDVWQFLRSVPELQGRVMEALRRLRLEKKKKNPQLLRGPDGGYVRAPLRMTRSMESWNSYSVPASTKS